MCSVSLKEKIYIDNSAKEIHSEDYWKARKNNFWSEDGSPDFTQIVEVIGTVNTVQGLTEVGVDYNRKS